MEVCYDGVWGRVCGVYWHIADTSVVCRQLGFSRGTKAATFMFTFLEKREQTDAA